MTSSLLPRSIASDFPWCSVRHPSAHTATAGQPPLFHNIHRLIFYGKNFTVDFSWKEFKFRGESEFSWKGLIFAERVQFSRKEFNFRGKSSIFAERVQVSRKEFKLTWQESDLLQEIFEGS